MYILTLDKKISQKINTSVIIESFELYMYCNFSIIILLIIIIVKIKQVLKVGNVLRIIFFKYKYKIFKDKFIAIIF